MSHPTLTLYRAGRPATKLHLVDANEYLTLCGLQIRTNWLKERKADLTKDIDNSEVCERCRWQLSK
jgi:hypothetical protein